jgi:hypothetical protein
MNTFKRDYLPVIAAVIAACVVSSIWYSSLLFGKQRIARLDYSKSSFLKQRFTAVTFLTYELRNALRP